MKIFNYDYMRKQSENIWFGYSSPDDKKYCRVAHSGVYFLAAEIVSNFSLIQVLKIGYTKNLRTRWFNIHRGFPGDLFLCFFDSTLFSIDEAKYKEKVWHQKFENYKLTQLQEWFLYEPVAKELGIFSEKCYSYVD